MKIAKDKTTMASLTLNQEKILKKRTGVYAGKKFPLIKQKDVFQMLEAII